MKLINLDLEASLSDIQPSGSGDLWVLVRLHGQPLGILPLDPSRTWGVGDLRRAIHDRLWDAIARHLVNDGLTAGDLKSFSLDSLPQRCPQRGNSGDLPFVTVAVCTRARPALLAACLDALERLDYPGDRLEILVVDNAPPDDATEAIVRARSGRLRYLREDRVGLDFARNAAVLEARGEIVAFTDDDVRVDAGWVRALARVFVQEPDAMCVTGLVVPEELDTDAQRLFERYGGFGRGFTRVYARADAAGPAAAAHGGTGKFGTGANMAYRRRVFDRIGLFDPALDVGTVTNGGGDLEMFFRVIKEGHLLVYEPAAIVRHQHRRTYEELRTQLTNNGIGFYSYLVRSALHYRDERAAIVRLGLWWLWYWNFRRLLMSFVLPRRFPRDLIFAELRGSFAGLWRYQTARRRAAAVVAAQHPQADRA
jgi:GT2 family glycosyltransferase